ncbi:MAG: ATP-dependent zinc metalloprotease FtsH [bacterium]
MRSILKNFFIFILVFLLLAGIFSSFSASLSPTKKVSISEFVQQVQQGSVQKVVVEGVKLTITLKNGNTETTQKEATDSLSTLLKNSGVSSEKAAAVDVTVKDQSGVLFFLGSILPFLIPFLLIGAFVYFMMRQIQGNNNRALSFGQSQAREHTEQDKRKRMTFKDVAGVREAKEELWEVVDFLKNPRKYTSMGAKIPKGVMLVGPPGTGKTLLARAVAGEADVPFFHMSGSEFVEMFVGVGASRVRDLFRRAKKASPCIIFIDEIDAVGRQRGSGLGGSHDEREQTLNQILVELDGFEQGTNVIVIAATNRPDVLDPALLRPGRFDRQVMLDPPDIADREQILRVHSRIKPLAANVDLRIIAERTPGFTGADLANLLNEAAILAARHNKKQVGMSECLESIEKVLLGPERKSHVLSDYEKLVTAYHEAGHALVAHELPQTDPVRKVSIISRGRAGGYTLKLPTEDRHLRTREEFLEELAVFVAGYVAEKEFFHDISTGPSNDLRQATKLARKLVMEYGMSEKLGARTFGEHEEMIFLGREITEQRNYSEKVAQVIDQEVERLTEGAIKTAHAILVKHRPKLEKIVAVLLEKETIEQDAFVAIVGEKHVTKPSLPRTLHEPPPAEVTPQGSVGPKSVPRTAPVAPTA